MRKKSGARSAQVMHRGLLVHRRVQPLITRLELQRQELRIMAALVQVAAMNPELGLVHRAITGGVHQHIVGQLGADGCSGVQRGEGAAPTQRRQFVGGPPPGRWLFWGPSRRGRRAYTAQAICGRPAPGPMAVLGPIAARAPLLQSEGRAHKYNRIKAPVCARVALAGFYIGMNDATQQTD